MHKIGDHIVKTGHGVCTIIDMTRIYLSSSANRRYYVISPVEQKEIKLHIP